MYLYPSLTKSLKIETEIVIEIERNLLKGLVQVTRRRGKSEI